MLNKQRLTCVEAIQYLSSVRYVLAPVGHPSNPLLLFSDASFALSYMSFSQLQMAKLHIVKG
ncbi:hypothetical protein A6452_39990 [Bradyrhizobium elkanii]|nr:hypothetical protein A6452_39990 [Bradyrhizobium elkanii]